jgi:hypothetical protein
MHLLTLYPLFCGFKHSGQHSESVIYRKTSVANVRFVRGGYGCAVGIKEWYIVPSYE